MAKQLTAMAVKNFTPGKARREVRDGGCTGLYLVIQASGHKSWALRFRRPSGRTAKLTLGPVDLSGRETDAEPAIGTPLTLASARGLAAEVHRQRARGRDVVSDRESERRRQQSDTTNRVLNSFAGAARDFVEQHAKVKTRRWEQTARMLGLDAELKEIRYGLAYRWKNKPVAEIDADEVHALIREVKVRGIPGLAVRNKAESEPRARAMYSCLAKMCSWLVGERRINTNPCEGVRRPDAPDARDRQFDDAQIVKFWSAADKERKEFSALLKVLLLTGCRLNEVARMNRSEISEDGTIWTIPGKRMKKKIAHDVPLSAEVRELIASVSNGSEWVFTTNGMSPVSGFSKIKSRLDTEMMVAPWRLHDVRRSAASGMARLQILPHVIEAVINHLSGQIKGVTKTYNRYDYAAEKKVALDRWAAHVTGLVNGSGSNVRPIRVIG